MAAVICLHVATQATAATAQCKRRNDSLTEVSNGREATNATVIHMDGSASTLPLSETLDETCTNRNNKLAAQSCTRDD
jgi:hypothetical protein